MGLKPLHAHLLGKVNIKPILLRQQTQDGQNLHPLPSPCQESQLCKGCPCFIWAFLRRVKRCYPPKIQILLFVSGQGGHGMGTGPWLIGSDFNVFRIMVFLMFLLQKAYLLALEVRHGPYGGVVESVLCESLLETGKVAILVVSFNPSSSYPNGPSLYGIANPRFKDVLGKASKGMGL
ncbi:hypothetical protein M9H77_18942 [Catharanthus roseus]|uniref:Uncharacterized protein n=1 Tax=Catharanthus roseus TaxID=4058 RepID=A0ACC0B8Y2_CATRO|nr:hypothetical protein M9H77_18942 [Catharanthus roseus]